MEPRTASLLPQGEIPLEDDALAAIDAQERAWDAPPLAVAPAERPPLGRSWLFDFAQGRFVPQKQGSPIPTYGVQALVGWVEKCLRTRRGAHPVHSDDYGLDVPDSIWGGSLDNDAIGELAGNVEDALLQHPRIAQVFDFAVGGWDETVEEEGALFVTFTIRLDDDTAVDVRNVGIA